MPTLLNVQLLTTSPSLADAIAAVRGDPSLSPPRRQRIAADVAIAANWLGRRPADLPARIKDLRPRLMALQPAALGISPGRLGNVLTNLRRAIEQLRGTGARGVPPVTQLSPAWAALYQAMAPTTWLRPALSQLLRYADSRGVAPHAMSDAIVDDWIAWRSTATQTLAKDPARARRKAVAAWGRARRVVAGWPQLSLSTPARRPRLTFALTAFPQAFQNDVAAFARLAGGGAPATGGGSTATGRYRRLLTQAPGQPPLAPRSISERINAVLLAASTLVREGEADLSAIVSLAQVANANVAGLVAETIEDRNGHRSGYAYTVVKHLLSVAVRCGTPTPAELTAFRQLLRLLKDGLPDGMTEKNRERLAQFDNPATLHRLVDLPQRLISQLERQRRKTNVTHAMALDAMIAIAVLVLCTLPIRRDNLVSMQMGRHLRLPVRKGEPGSFTFAAWEVKNHRELAAALPPWKVDLIELYLRHYRPLLADAGNPYLFPAVSGSGHRALNQFAKLVCERIGKHAGVTINLHLFRHLMAMVLLRKNPQNYHVVEQLLGHAPGSRSTHCYAELASRQAAACLDQTLADAEEKQQALRRFTPRHRR